MVSEGERDSTIQGVKPAQPVRGVSGSWTRPRLIATEEAFAPPELLPDLIDVTGKSPSTAVRYAHTLLKTPENKRRLCDFDARVADMDAAGIDMQLLELVSPGVQLFEPAQGTSWAIRCNDYLSSIIRKYPGRFAGLAAIAPQDPTGSVAEIDRAINGLGLNGIIINSHTNGEFLDEPRYWPILEAACRRDAAIYIHPTFPPRDMEKPLEPYALTGAVWGFQAETGLHAARMIMGGVFDRFPDLRIVLGHMGEGIPYWLFRMDQIYGMMSSLPVLPENIVRLKRRPSEYFRQNFYVTTSGMFWNEVLHFALAVLGPERILFAVDYPFEKQKEAADWLCSAPLRPAELAMIAHSNSERLFHIGGNDRRVSRSHDVGAAR